MEEGRRKEEERRREVVPFEGKARENEKRKAMDAQVRCEGDEGIKERLDEVFAGIEGLEEMLAVGREGRREGELEHLLVSSSHASSFLPSHRHLVSRRFSLLVPVQILD